MGVLKVKDPVTGVWLDIAGGAGAQGQQGVTGPTGVTGPPGPTGPEADEVWIGNAAPDASILPTTDLWYDPDDTASLGTVPFPAGGALDQALVKATVADGDVAWGGPHLKLTGGTITGNVIVTGNTDIDGILTVPTVTGNVNFAANISANAVEDRTGWAWETFDLNPHFAPNWGNGDFQSGQFPGPAAVYRNRYSVLVMVSAHINPGNWVENAWMNVINAGAIPVGWRPQFDLWQTIQGVETDETGSTFEGRITNTGTIQVQMKGGSLDWQDDTRIPFNFSYPRSNT